MINGLHLEAWELHPDKLASQSPFLPQWVIFPRAGWLAVPAEVAQIADAPSGCLLRQG